MTLKSVKILYFLGMRLIVFGILHMHLKPVGEFCIGNTLCIQNHTKHMKVLSGKMDLLMLQQAEHTGAIAYIRAAYVITTNVQARE